MAALISSLCSVTGGIVLCIFISTTAAETCMKAVRSDGFANGAINGDVSDTGNNFTTNGGDNRRHSTLHSWRWVNFDCAGTGCCGETGSQHCCPEKTSLGQNSGLLAAVSAGIIFLIVTIVLVVVICACCRSRQKPSRDNICPRQRAASTTPSSFSLPPSYETTITMPADTTGSGYPVPDTHAPPSYDEVMSSDATEPASLHDSHSVTSTHLQVPAQHQQYALHGTDNPAFSVEEENATTNGIFR